MQMTKVERRIHVGRVAAGPRKHAPGLSWATVGLCALLAAGACAPLDDDVGPDSGVDTLEENAPDLVEKATIPITSFTKVFILGDSLSDQHNQYESPVPACPNRGIGYWNGRFANGYNWVDYVTQDNAALSSKIRNYATGGSKVLVPAISRPQLRSQAQKLVKENPASTVSNSLVVVWAGANDLKETAELSDRDRPPADRFGYDVADELETNVIEYLAGQGVDHFVIIGVPRIDRVPVARNWSFLQRNWMASAANRVNTKLKAYAAAHDYVFVDVAARIGEVLDHRVSSINMTDTTEPCHTHAPCLSGFGVRYHEKVCAKKMFFDAMHPTTLAQCGIAKWIERAISSQYTISGGEQSLESCAKREAAGPYGGTAARPIRYDVQTAVNPTAVTCQARCVPGRWTGAKGNVSLPNPVSQGGSTAVGWCACDAGGYFEAELHDGSFNTRRLSNSTGHTGTGFEDYQGIGAWVEFDVEAPIAGSYSLSFRYAAETNRPCELQIDGRTRAPLGFAATNSSRSWRVQSVPVTLTPGHHTVRVKATRSSGPNLDAMFVRAPIHVMGTGSKRLASAASSYTLAANVNAAGAHKLIVTVSGERDRKDPNTSIVGVRFGGVALTKAVQAKNYAEGPVAIYYLDSPPETGSLVVTTSGTFNGVHASWLLVQGTAAGLVGSGSNRAGNSVDFIGAGLVVTAYHSDGATLAPHATAPMHALMTSKNPSSVGAAGYHIKDDPVTSYSFVGGGAGPVTVGAMFVPR